MINISGNGKAVKVKKIKRGSEILVTRDDGSAYEAALEHNPDIVFIDLPPRFSGGYGETTCI